MKVILNLKFTEVVMKGDLERLSDDYFPLALLKPVIPKPTTNRPTDVLDTPEPRQQT